MEVKELTQNASRDGSADRRFEQGRSLVGAPAANEPRPRADQLRQATAERIGALAGAANHAAGDLEAAFPQTAHFLHDTASGLDQISNFLGEPSLDDITALIGNMARRQPAAVVAGLVLAGMALSWFLKSSGGNTAAAA
jgi:hypothetical protein